MVEKEIHPLACMAALGAEAAGIMQGEDGFWAFHDWLMTHRAEFNDATMTAAAEELGMARKEFWEALVKPDIQFWTGDDVRAAKELGYALQPLQAVAVS